MGYDTQTRASYQPVYQQATRGGAQAATHAAEERVRRGEGFDPLVDPKGLPQHGTPVRPSRPRFTQREDGLWELNIGISMPEETLLDTTGSMGDNVDKAFRVLPDGYDMYMALHEGRYDVHMATATFGDVEDRTPPPLFRTQFEMDAKIAQQMAMLVPSKNGCGNGKEDPQFGLFAGAYLTKARINAYEGMKRYHFTASDEPVQEWIDYSWLKRLFGEDVLDHAAQNGFAMGAKDLPSTAQVIQDLKKQAHAFFLYVETGHHRASRQWLELYGDSHFVKLPYGKTDYIHFVKAAVVGLTEGVLDLETTRGFLMEHGADDRTAALVVESVAGIPLGAQMAAPDFDRMPKAGDLFRNKTDIWPLTSEELAEYGLQAGAADDLDDDDVKWD